MQPAPLPRVLGTLLAKQDFSETAKHETVQVACYFFIDSFLLIQI